MAKGQKDEAGKMKQEVAALGDGTRCKNWSWLKSHCLTIVRLPNLPSDLVPPGKTPAESNDQEGK
jgi:seryl-tRNA synthetase